jgi:hypothetical protein
VPAAEPATEVALLRGKRILTGTAVEALQHRPPDLLRADLDGAVVQEPRRRCPGVPPQLLEPQYGLEPLVPTVLELDERAASREGGVRAVQSGDVLVEGLQQRRGAQQITVLFWEVAMRRSTSSGNGCPNASGGGCSPRTRYCSYKLADSSR